MKRAVKFLNQGIRHRDKNYELLRSAILVSLFTLLHSCYAPSLSSGKGEPNFSHVTELCELAITESVAPGIVAFVAHKGETIYHKSFGLADISTGRTMENDAIFRIDSQTKAITATAVMMLWEQGLLGLDDPISKYIPEFENPQVIKSFDASDTSYVAEPTGSEITIRQLLAHISGIGYGNIGEDEGMEMLYKKAGVVTLASTMDISIEENIKTLATLPLQARPGEEFIYGMGLDVLGYLVEILSGMSFDTYLRSQIFDPLNMDDTWFYLPEELAPRLIPVHVNDDTGQWLHRTVGSYDPDYPIKGAKRLFLGGAGLSSTAEDYAKFLQMYLKDGVLYENRILEPATIDTIMSNQIGNLWGNDPDHFYGLAFMVLTEKGGAEGSEGSRGTFSWMGYFNTAYFADPITQTIGLIMMQVEIPEEEEENVAQLRGEFWTEVCEAVRSEEKFEFTN